MNEVRKRKLGLSSAEDQPHAKQYYIVLGPEDPNNTARTDSDTDSARSAETALVEDTSDTCTKSSASEPELSPASLSEASDLNGSSDSTSSFNGPAFIDVVINVEDDHSWADVSLNSDSNSFHHDAEIPKADYWQCARCGCKKNNPVFRYCEKCFQRRKEESLPRPKTVRRKKRRRSHHFRHQPASKLGLLQTARVHLTDEPGPSNVVPESSSQETLTSVGSHSSQDSGRSTISDGHVDLCNGCETEQINAAFYHTSFAHVWGCYKCSKRAWKPHRRCPICNGQSRVIKLFK